MNTTDEHSITKAVEILKRANNGREALRKLHLLLEESAAVEEAGRIAIMTLLIFELTDNRSFMRKVINDALTVERCS